MADEMNPQNLDLPELARRCEQETKRYFNTHENDPRYCFELFRRAIQDGDDAAWEYIYLCYSREVASWVIKKGFESTGESVEYFVNGAFAKFSTAMTKERFQGFSELEPLLGYFKTCVFSLIVDHLRLAGPIIIDGKNDPPDEVSKAASPEEQVMEQLGKQELWEKVNQQLKNEKERVVIQGLFVFGLKPRELYKQVPTFFADVGEIYEILQNVIARFRRNPDFRKFLGQGN